MKKFLVATAALASMAMASPVFAADMPVKAAPPVVAPALYNWTGFYLGVEGGAVMGQRTDFQFVPGTLCLGESCSTTTACNFFSTCIQVGHPLHGGFVGGEAGFNWQAPGNRWVFGIEGDGNWSELEEALTCSLIFPNYSCATKIRDFETVRVRIGYALGPTGSFLAFVTGGWATASQGEFIGQLFPTFLSVTHWERANGFAVGGGAEYGILPNLSLKAEVLYVDLGRKNYPTTVFKFSCGTDCTEFNGFFPARIQTDFIAARMALNWRFNWGKGKAPAAVVASY